MDASPYISDETLREGAVQGKVKMSMII